MIEFAYNNSYQASIQMTPYEALYGMPCRSPVCWMEVGERPSTGPDLIRDTSKKVDWIPQRSCLLEGEALRGEGAQTEEFLPSAREGPQG